MTTNESRQKIITSTLSGDVRQRLSKSLDVADAKASQAEADRAQVARDTPLLEEFANYVEQSERAVANADGFPEVLESSISDSARTKAIRFAASSATMTGKGAIHMASLDLLAKIEAARANRDELIAATRAVILEQGFKHMEAFAAEHADLLRRYDLSVPKRPSFPAAGVVPSGGS